MGQGAYPELFSAFGNSFLILPIKEEERDGEKNYNQPGSFRELPSLPFDDPGHDNHGRKQNCQTDVQPSGKHERQHGDYNHRIGRRLEICRKAHGRMLYLLLPGAQWAAPTKYSHSLLYADLSA